MTEPWENSPKIARTLELTEFEWNLVRNAVYDQWDKLRSESSSIKSSLTHRAARWGCRVHADALQTALKQLPDPPKKDK